MNFLTILIIVALIGFCIYQVYKLVLDVKNKNKEKKKGE